ncbi:hypothetical protein [Streptomyces triticagri]|nr:hypothetical protein [Streptomyces triticagri]
MEELTRLADIEQVTDVHGQLIWAAAPPSWSSPTTPRPSPRTNASA